MEDKTRLLEEDRLLLNKSRSSGSPSGGSSGHSDEIKDYTEFQGNYEKLPQPLDDSLVDKIKHNGAITTAKDLKDQASDSIKRRASDVYLKSKRIQQSATETAISVKLKTV